MTFLRIVLRSSHLLPHDLFRKPGLTFRDHALAQFAAEIVFHWNIPGWAAMKIRPKRDRSGMTPAPAICLRMIFPKTGAHFSGSCSRHGGVELAGILRYTGCLTGGA